jgi:hypothetical protein
MPIRMGREPAKIAADVGDPSDGEALYGLLAIELDGMSMTDQVELVTALQSSTAWSSLTPRLRKRFQDVAEAFLG